MEIPLTLKNLYKHWRQHAQVNPRKGEPSQLNRNTLDQMVSFASERMRVWEKKESGLGEPYSHDPILQKYRFCNIYRELDRQTIEIHSILKPIRSNYELWLLNLAYLRFVCNPSTVEKTGFLSYDRNDNAKVYTKLLRLPKPKYGSAYVFPISIIQKSEWNTREKFFTQYLPLVIPRVSKIISSFENISVVDALAKILPVFGFNFTFHWTEILIDIAYQHPRQINLFAPFPSGPGALPTLEKLSPHNPVSVLLSLTSYSPTRFPYLTLEGAPIHFSAENWEGICCEFRKYDRLRQGKGRKRYY